MTPTPLKNFKLAQVSLGFLATCDHVTDIISEEGRTEVIIEWAGHLVQKGHGYNLMDKIKGVYHVKCL